MRADEACNLEQKIQLCSLSRILMRGGIYISEVFFTEKHLSREPFQKRTRLWQYYVRYMYVVARLSSLSALFLTVRNPRNVVRFSLLALKLEVSSLIVICKIRVVFIRG